MNVENKYSWSLCWVCGLTLLVVLGLLLSVVPTAQAASGQTSGASTKQTIGSDSPDLSSPLTYQQESNRSGWTFYVTRNGYDSVIVEINDAVVGDQLSNETVSLFVNDGDRAWETMNLTSENYQNGKYKSTFDTPREDEFGGESLVNATVTIPSADVSDEAHLHRVETSDTPVWTNNSNLFIPVAQTIGITESDSDSIQLSVSENNSFQGSFRPDQNLFVVNSDNINVEDSAGKLQVKVKSDGNKIARDRTISPEIRYLHDNVELWHPYIKKGSQYEVTVNKVNGKPVNNNNSDTKTARRTGSVSVPASNRIAGADTVNVTLSGGNTVINAVRIKDISSLPQTTAVRNGPNTIQFDHSLTGLSVSSVVVQQNDAPMYVSGSNIETTNRQLSLNGATVTENTTLQMTTDAGIVEVVIRGSQSGGSSSDSGFGPLDFILPLTIGLVLSVVGGGLGFLASGWLDEPSDIMDMLLVLIIVTSTLGLIFLIGYMVLDFVENSPLSVAVGLLLVLFVGIFGFNLGHRRSRVSGGSAKTTHTVSLSVTNGTSRLTGESHIEAMRQSDQKKETTTATNGSGKLQLPEGTWTIRATQGGHPSPTERIEVGGLTGGKAVTLAIDLPDVRINVEDSNFGAIHNASVRMDTNGNSTVQKTGPNGVVTFEPPADADAVSITVTHDRYHDTVKQYQLAGGGIQETIEPDQKNGSVQIVSQIDGTPVGSLDCNIAANDEFLRKLYNSDESVTITTNESGLWDREILVGKYRATLQLPPDLGDLFKTSGEDFVIRQNQVTEVPLVASFTWELSNQQRSRIQGIRTDLEDITAKSGIDTAIPQYYASVIETVLDAVEQFPSQGQYFAEVDTHPDAFTDATLDAAETTTQTIAEAMSSKRNRDLFTACSDMSDATVYWDGAFNLERLVERLNQDSMDLRRTFAQEADNVSERIDAERGSLSEIAPAREMLEYIELPESGDQVDQIVATHVAILMLTAIDDLFDHQPLRDRLSRTVF